jgi:carbohydrate-selective porin OprB
MDQPFLDEQPAPTGLRQLSNVPDDIGYQLQESAVTIDAIFPYGPLTPLHRIWDRATGHLEESVGLDLGLNYTAIYQWADTTVSGPRDAGDGDLDFFGRWNMLGCEHCSPGALVFSSETRHKYSAIAPNRLDTGTAGGTIVGFGVQDFSLQQLYWEAGSYEDRYIARIGKMDSGLIYDGGRYVSSNYAFFSPAFADTAPMSLPTGLGVAGAIYPTDTTYILAGIHDANGKRTTSGFNTFFGEGEYFTALELGWFPFVDQPYEGLYHVTLWNIDARQNTGSPRDRGIAATIEQPLGCDGKYVPFLRYAYAHRGLNGIRQNLSFGMGIEDFFGQNDDVVGLAAAWQESSAPTSRDQYVLEAFYRFYITPHTHLSPDIQVVIDPANAPTKDAVTVFGLRFRTLY